MIRVFLFQLKSIFKPPIILNTLNHSIQNIFSRSEFNFCQSDNLFAVIRKDPHTVLHSHKAVFRHKSCEPLSDWFALFRYIKDDHSPATIPFPLFSFSARC